MYTRLLMILFCFAITNQLGFVLNADEPLKTKGKSKPITAAQRDYFEKHIRPIFARHCYECHSAKNNQSKGSLQLDSKAGWKQGGDSGPAIVPGDPDNSPVIMALRYTDEFSQMPPDKKLPQAVIDKFEQWVKQGAADPREDAAPLTRHKQGIDFDKAREFWSLQKIKPYPQPEVKHHNRVRDPIDAYILAGLEAANLKPVPTADKRTLIRRVTFDLTGLPPTDAEIKAFLDDAGAAAFETVVDRLLNSDQFGERWGQHWLDLARYADTNGGDFNATFYNAWRYRNYVIDAFQNDKPYDQFIKEQLAGDLMKSHNDEQRSEQLIATGYLAIGSKMLSERDKVKLQLDIVDEQLDAIGKTFMGLTLGCARCHDHKFDPIPTRDYYSIGGILNNTVTIEGESQQYVSAFINPELPIDPEHAATLAGYEQAKQQRNAEIQQLKTQIKQADTKQKLTGIVVDDTKAQVAGDWKKSVYSPLFYGDGYIHDQKLNKGQSTVTWTPHLPIAGMYEVRIAYAGGGGRDSNVPITVHHATGETPLKLDQSKQGSINKTWHVLGRFRFDQGTHGWVRLSNAGTTEFVIADAVQFIPVAQLAQNKSDKNNAGGNEPASEIAELKSKLKSLESELKDLEKNAPKPAPSALAVRDRADITDLAVRIRGEVANKGPIVKRGFLQVLSDTPLTVQNKEQSGRLELAKWIASPENPLTARVMVNRIWQHLMGEGIVRSVDNFGQLGERPTHPELLDTLAHDFIESGWSVKTMIRRIALSETYRLSSNYDERSYQADPDNRLLWRANRRRLSAEEIRDALLFVSGHIDLTPAESRVADLKYLAVNNNQQGDIDVSAGRIQKRSIYLPIIRNFVPEQLTTFNFANRDMVTGKRSITTVPSQALFLMNNPFVSQAAQRTAQNILTIEADDATLVRQTYEAVLGRTANENETARALHFLQSIKPQYKLAEGVESNERKLTAWTRLVHILFASTEFQMLN